MKTDLEPFLQFLNQSFCGAIELDQRSLLKFNVIPADIVMQGSAKLVGGSNALGRQIGSYGGGSLIKKRGIRRLLSRPRSVADAIQRVAEISQNAGIYFCGQQRFLQRAQLSNGARQTF